MKSRYWFSEEYWVKEAEQAGESWRLATDEDWRQLEREDPEAAKSWRHALMVYEVFKRPERAPKLWVRVG